MAAKKLVRDTRRNKKVGPGNVPNHGMGPTGKMQMPAIKRGGTMIGRTGSMPMHQ